MPLSKARCWRPHGSQLLLLQAVCVGHARGARHHSFKMPSVLSACLEEGSSAAPHLPEHGRYLEGLAESRQAARCHACAVQQRVSPVACSFLWSSGPVQVLHKSLTSGCMDMQVMWTVVPYCCRRRWSPLLPNMSALCRTHMHLSMDHLSRIQSCSKNYATQAFSNLLISCSKGARQAAQPGIAQPAIRIPAGNLALIFMDAQISMISYHPTSRTAAVPAWIRNHISSSVPAGRLQYSYQNHLAGMQKLLSTSVWPDFKQLTYHVRRL